MKNGIYTIDELKVIIDGKRNELARVYNVSKIFVFGSYARGEQNPQSDIDFLIETSKPIDLLKHANLVSYFEKLLGKKIDVGTIKGLKPTIRKSVLDEAIAL